MKKFLMTLLLTLPIMCVFNSCSDDDDEEVLTGELTSEQIGMLQGTWDVVSVKGYDFPGKVRMEILRDELRLLVEDEQGEGDEIMGNYTFSVDGVTIMLKNQNNGVLSAKARVLNLSVTSAKIEVEELEYGFGKYTMNLKKRD